MTVIRVICGWCGKKIGEKDGHGTEGRIYGICDKCLARNFPVIAEKCKNLHVTEWDRYPDLKE